MSGKMNWGRVQKQRQLINHGTQDMDLEPEWPQFISRDDALGDRIPGCTCDKRVGYTTPHKKSCPLGKGAIRPVAQKPIKK
jgi:hypothetical protein